MELAASEGVGYLINGPTLSHKIREKSGIELFYLSEKCLEHWRNAEIEEAENRICKVRFTGDAKILRHHLLLRPLSSFAYHSSFHSLAASNV